MQYRANLMKKKRKKGGGHERKNRGKIGIQHTVCDKSALVKKGGGYNFQTII